MTKEKKSKDITKDITIGYSQFGTPITLNKIRKKLEKKQEEKEKHVEKVISRFRKAPEKLVGVIGKALEMKPKKFIFKRERATIVLPTKKTQPILRRSELFNKEYEKEKNLLGWK